MRVLPKSSCCRFTIVLVALALFVGASGAAAFTPTRAEHRAPELVPPAPDGQWPLIIETTQPTALAARVVELGGRIQYAYENLDGLGTFGSQPRGAGRIIRVAPFGLQAAW